MSDKSADFPEIYLQADADADYAGEGRLWCQDDVWTGDPENSAPTKYIRADLVDAHLARITKLEEAASEYMAAAEAVFDWMNGNDLVADHHEQYPEDYDRISAATYRLRAALAPKAAS